MTLARRVWWLLAALLVLGTTTPLTAAAAAQLRAPQGEYAGTLRFEIDSMTPTLVSTSSSTVVISGRMVNTGSEELTGVVARWQRGPAFTSTTEVQDEIDEPGQPETVLTAFSPVTDSIAAGGTVPFTLQTDAFLRPRSGLGVQDPGVYPIMLNVNASFASGPDSGARVGELHALLTVVSVPGETTVVGTRQSVSMVMPLVDRPHRDPTGAFFDDDLVSLISAGGRLDDVLDAAVAPGLPAGAVTLAVDPELLEELRLMSAGYTVGPYVFDVTGGTGTAGTSTSDTTTSTTTPGSATSGTATTSSDVSATDPPTATPTADGTTPDADGTTPTGTTDPTAPATGTPPTGATVQPVPGPSSVPGSGTAAAAAFLDRLRGLSADIPILVLPYTDIDAVAAVRAGRPELVTAAIDRGRTLAADVLGPQARLVDDLSWPIDGLVDPATLSVLRGAGMTTALLDPSGVDGAPGDQVSLATDAGDVTAVLASSDVPDDVVALNHFTALTGQRWLGGDTGATVIAPSRTWQPDLDEYATVTALMQTLSGAGLVSGVALEAAAVPRTPAAADLAYPDAAVDRELPGAFFARVQGLARDLTSAQQTFDALPTDDPATAAPGDLFATVRDGLGRQAAGGFRIDPGAAIRSDAAVGAALDQVQAAVAITPSTSVYTLTSATSPLLVTIRNDLPYTAHVRIRVDPDDARRAGITVTDAGIQTLPPFRSTTVRLEAETIRAGSSDVRISLRSPDGAAWGETQTLKLRSTAIGSFTVVLIIAAAAILVLTTAIRIRKRFRQRSERIAAGLQ